MSQSEETPVNYPRFKHKVCVIRRFVHALHRGTTHPLHQHSFVCLAMHSATLRTSAFTKPLFPEEFA